MSSEMHGFVFSVIFIVFFATLLSSVPAGLKGAEESPNTVVPIDPSLITGFEETENYTAAAYSAGVSYTYDLGGRSWLTIDGGSYIYLGAKILVWGIFWFGAVDDCKFTAPDGTDRGTNLAFTEIDTDAEEGGVRYALKLVLSGDSGGVLVIYWNTTKYETAAQAWDNAELYLLHGVGIENTATNNIAALLVSLLFLQLPDVPVLVNAFIAIPVWACIAFVLWFVIKEMIPFV